ncbi:MAG: type II secretion system GspH family protein [Aquificaceae bacterium]|nr:type II secretion system GspH family protein [Aquificaceae bacterium]
MRCLLPFTPCPLRKKGLTLMELLVVIGIIAVLAGILYVALAPVRGKARLTHCINNFRQIHLALESYRQDWDGVDADTATTFADLGLPPQIYIMEGSFPFYKEKYLVGTKEIWKCPSFWSSPLAIKHVGPDYVYVPLAYFKYLATKDPEFKGDALAIEQAFRKRRGELPLVTDDYHDPDYYENGGLQMIILRLNGKIEVKMVQPKPPGVRGFEVN